MYGFYPEASRWRVNLTYLVGALLIIPMAMPTVPHKKWNAIALFVLFPLLAYVLLSGGSFGLEHVETTQWGGLLLTLVIAVPSAAAQGQDTTQAALYRGGPGRQHRASQPRERCPPCPCQGRSV